MPSLLQMNTPKIPKYLSPQIHNLIGRKHMIWHNNTNIMRSSYGMYINMLRLLRKDESI